MNSGRSRLCRMLTPARETAVGREGDDGDAHVKGVEVVVPPA